MHAAPLAANPFALLTDPETVLRAVESSPRLESLNRRICRPLDRAGRDGEGHESGVAEERAGHEREATVAAFD